MAPKIITMTCWRRPIYTRQVIDNLKKCIGFNEYILLVNIEPGYPEVLKVFDGLSNCEVIVNDRVLGCGINTFNALQRGFDRTDFVIHIEDDTVPGIDCLRYFEWIYKTYKDDKQVFTATAYNKIYNITDIRRDRYFAVFRLSYYTGWVWATWKDRFEEMEKDWNFGSWDTHINHKLRKNRVEIRPYLSRSQNIGEHLGAFNNPEWWRREQYNPVWIDSVINGWSNDNILDLFSKSSYVEIEKKDIDIETFNKLTKENNENGRSWYIGLGGNWWWGLSEEEARHKL